MQKIYWQIGVCTLIFSAAICGAKIETEPVAKYYKAVQKAVMTETTRQELRQAVAVFSDKAARTPAYLVSAAKAANEQTKYGAAIDEKSDSAIKQVHAVAGGMVEKSGRNNKLGLYVQIRHESGVSTYGNLADISVVEAERVQRGEIIGSYDTRNEQEFYYELDENL